MRREIYFDRFRQTGWPDLRDLEAFFIAPKGHQWSYRGGNDSWGLSVEGVNGTDHLDIADRRRIDIRLYMTGHPDHGVYLLYDKAGGGHPRERYNSKGDLSRLNEHIRDLHGTPLPVGLLIPFEKAWLAVKEFMETGGALPKSIEWVEDSKLPDWAFPSP
ncbi:MAG TPA: Imm1 family immunity protein [Micropepsaceae bacterium]|nr:Imm1 family immunity protein [Micropepsaceae bacterium]